MELRQASTRLARAEMLTSLVGLVEGRVKKRKSSAFEAEFKFEVGRSVRLCPLFEVELRWNFQPQQRPQPQLKDNPNPHKFFLQDFQLREV